MASDEWTTFFVGWNRISWNFHKLITSSYVNPRFRGVLHKKQTANRVTEVSLTKAGERTTKEGFFLKVVRGGWEKQQHNINAAKQ